jgi:hypothetical protein
MARVNLEVRITMIKRERIRCNAKGAEFPKTWK